jgi:hypothetical protein
MGRIRLIGNDISHHWAAAIADHNDMMSALQRRHGKRLGTIFQRRLDAL